MKNQKTALITGIAVAGAIAGGIVASRRMRRSIPKGVTAVRPFDLEKYLGMWYEIARFSFKWEKGLENVTANYSLNEDGSVKVVNGGYDPRKGEWQESVGKAVFAGDENTGMLKVSFFGPFYTGYNVIAIEGNYKYALVFGKNTDYMWMLSREKEMPEKVKSRFMQIALDAGYNLSRLVWTEQD